MRNSTCPSYSRCGKTGHFLQDGKWERCACLVKELNKQRLGIFNTADVQKKTPLTALVNTDTVIEGPISVIRQHVARVLLDLIAQEKTFGTMDAYRLVEIFLDKDEEFQTSQDLAGFDLFILLLGFGDVANRRLPDLVNQALNRRELVQKTTWVILGLPLPSVAGRYDASLGERLVRMKRVGVTR